MYHVPLNGVLEITCISSNVDAVYFTDKKEFHIYGINNTRSTDLVQFYPMASDRVLQAGRVHG